MPIACENSSACLARQRSPWSYRSGAGPKVGSMVPGFGSMRTRLSLNMFKRFGLIAAFASFAAGTSAQTLVGSASAFGPGCYQVTPNQNSVSGAVWFPGTVDVSESFELRADVYLGNSDGGADGMAFVLRNPASLSLGSTPGGANQGFGGITPSLIVEMDTYTNSLNPAWDPVGNPADHLAILSAGSPSHLAATSFAGPVAAVPPNANIEDGQYHELRITWDSETELFQVYFDCLLRLEAYIDVPAVVGGNSGKYGFTASTGGLSNAHGVCDVVWNPFSPDVLPDELALCPGNEVTWTLPTGATNVLWAPSDGLSSTTAAQVTLTASVEAVYTVTWTDPCGGEHSDQVEVGLVLTDDVFTEFDLCSGSELTLDPAGPSAEVQWSNGESSQTLVVNTGGTFIADVNLNGCAYTWTADVAMLPAYDLELGEDVVLCSGETAVLSAADATWAGAPPEVTWSDGNTDLVRSDLGPGNYSVEIQAAGCVYTDAVTLSASPITGVDLGADVVLCWYEEETWQSGYSTATTGWSGLDAAGTWQALSAAPEWTWSGDEAANWQALAVLVAVGNCVASDTVSVSTVAEFDPQLPEEVHFCEGTTIVLEAASGADAYLWAGGPATPGYAVDEGGVATLTATVSGCTVQASVVVVEDPVPPVDCGPDVFVCEGTPVVLNAGVFLADGFAWSGPAGNGSSTQFEAPVSGTYSVTVLEGECSATDEIEVTIQPLPVFDLGEDRLACPGVPEVLVAVGLPSEANLTWGHGPTDASIEVDQTAVYTAYAEWNGCYHYDAVQVSYAAALELDLASTYLKCPEDTIHLNVQLPENVFPVDYAWSTGTTEAMEHFPGHGDFAVSVSNACEGLEAAFTIELESCDCSLFVPTGFTPDNDGVNDAWKPEFNCPTTVYRLSVLDRWGKVVFATEDPSAHWWGQVTNEAVDLDPYFGGNGLYHWVLELNYFQKGDARATYHTGHVLLIR